MNKIIITVLMFLTINIFGYQWVSLNNWPDIGGLCDEHTHITISNSSFSAYWEPRIIEIVKSAMNYWNEAGSEHMLYYGSGDDETNISYSNNYSNTSLTDATAYYYAELPDGDCLSPDNGYITINKKKFFDNQGDLITPNPDYPQATKASSHEMVMLITHELGHILGLGHTQDSGDGSNDYYSILMDPYDAFDKHLTEDDKYGVRSLYGKDDRNIVSGRTSNNSSTINPYSVRYYTTGNSDFQTYSKPQLTYQPVKNTTSKAYDYIMTWVKSDTRKINYRFVSECSSGTDICAATDMTSGNGMTLGEVHQILNSETLTAPSLAMKTDGSQAMIVWRQETENQPSDLADDIYYAKINGSEHSGGIWGIQVYDNNDKTPSYYKAKTMSAPTVIWVPSWSRFVIFYTEMKQLFPNYWKIAYIVANSDGTFPAEPVVNYIQYGSEYLKSNWNPMAINCNQQTRTGSEACLLVYDKISTDNHYETSTAYHVAELDFKVLIPKTTEYKFDIYPINTSDLGTRKNYGHLSLASVKQPKEGSYYFTHNRLTRITTSDIEKMNQLVFTVYEQPYPGSGWTMFNSSESIYDVPCSNNYPGMGICSVSGQSIVHNARDNFYRYLWIQE